MNKIKDATALSLFSGIGGFEAGMARCGFTFLKTLEWDEKCCETLEANRKLLGTVEKKIEAIDITKTSPEDFYDGIVDYIVGGPPMPKFFCCGKEGWRSLWNK